jgi:hypothetical protein
MTGHNLLDAGGAQGVDVEAGVGLTRIAIWLEKGELLHALLSAGKPSLR